VKLGLIGYGKLGKEIERVAVERGWEIAFKQNSNSTTHDIQGSLVDVVIHAATPATLVQDVRLWAELKKPIVIGTTGWYNEIAEVKSLAEKNDIGIIYASNFSIGVQIFFRLLKQAGTMIDKFPDYDAFIREAHHKEKLDAPSGTALQAGAILLDSIKRKKELLTQQTSGKIRPEQLQVSSVRAGAIVGEHAVTIDSPADAIEIRHTAKNRGGFAAGALLAAEWIQGKRGLFTMEDVLADLFKG
jgi:4-hydroxy-tetrahydrodipicolinate reductase